MRYSFLFDKKLDVDFNMKNFEILLVKFEEFLYFIVIKFLELELFKVLLVLFVFLFLLFVSLVLGVLVFIEKFKILFLFVMEKKLKVVV